MLQTFTTISEERDSVLAGAAIAAAIRESFKGAAPQVVLVFASSQHDYPALLAALDAGFGGASLITGASSAGEFTHNRRGEGLVSVLALRSDQLRFTLGVGEHVKRSPIDAARAAVSAFRGSEPGALPFRTAMVLTDALAGFADEIVEEMTMATGGNYNFFGGGAGDDGRFQKTHVFAGTRALTDSVVALEIQSRKPIGIGVSHGWLPASSGLRVTESDGTRLISLNGIPAADVFAEHSLATGQKFDASDPLPFFLHNILGIVGIGGHRLRVPLSVEPDGSIICAAALPEGATVHLMKTTDASSIRAAEVAARSALDALAGNRPAVGLVFDCVATRLRLGDAFDHELHACAGVLHSIEFMGCNTYGQIARAEGQFSGFHNCTAVVCLIPE